MFKIVSLVLLSITLLTACSTTEIDVSGHTVKTKIDDYEVIQFCLIEFGEFAEYTFKWDRGATTGGQNVNLALVKSDIPHGEITIKYPDNVVIKKRLNGDRCTFS